ncbi:ABC transporter permease [Niallia endozanthoxylica]|uniref:ABC transporter permease n=1 Tax=Niallia endozanthoxylica TaxID=2036016 RepID=A0A5J5I7H2_9BACI|nr:ABC transporter permease [Niallia endozanthoxylica]KAA9031656.1 ABC transporter permease [Niallia endozanthoxylica]
MFNEKLLWKERFSRTSKEFSRYLRYILNGHLVIVFVFLIGTAAYYYQEWLKTLPESFPSAIIMALCLAFLLTYSPIFTFMSEADRIFLLPLETKLNGYFRKSLLISFLGQIYLLVIGLAVFMPMYAAVNEGNFKRFFSFAVIMLVVKWINLTTRWYVQYYRETTVHRTDSLIRFFVNIAFLYLLFSNAAFYFVLACVLILIGLCAYYKKQTKEKGLKWEFLIEQDERRMTSFYRLANLFTDVPKLKNRIKRREWLDFLLIRVPFQQSASFTFLFMRTFLRSGDYWGLFVRLTLIGAGAIYLLTWGIGQIILVILFLYLTGFQLLPLWKHHQNHSLLELYPINGKVKEKTFLDFLRKVLWTQSILLSLVVAGKGDFLYALGALAAGILFSVYFVSYYSKRKIQD